MSMIIKRWLAVNGCVWAWFPFWNDYVWEKDNEYRYV